MWRPRLGGLKVCNAIDLQRTCCLARAHALPLCQFSFFLRRILIKISTNTHTLTHALILSHLVDFACVRVCVRASFENAFLGVFSSGFFEVNCWNGKCLKKLHFLVATTPKRAESSGRGWDVGFIHKWAIYFGIWWLLSSTIHTVQINLWFIRYICTYIHFYIFIHIPEFVFIYLCARFLYLLTVLVVVAAAAVRIWNFNNALWLS